MHKIATSLFIALIIAFAGRADACQMRAAAAAEGSGAHDVMAQRMALMQERDSLMLETVQLLKEVAKDKETKAKAEALEKRIQANIEKHAKMHAMMMDGGMMHQKDGCCGGGSKPCPMKDTPADKKAN